uniref:Uncharacterized protein n=1 Tax=Sphaeramia orbicularis TaxID=375764 RepID=A0A673C8H8_9TELE
VVSKMELNTKKTSSQALLTCGNGEGLYKQVIIVVLSFLPQMAEANKQLKKEMEEAPAGHFDIESVEEADRVIEMDVALVELSGSDSSSEDDVTSDSEEESDSDDNSKITEQNLKLPGDKGKKRKANIQVLDQQGE